MLKPMLGHGDQFVPVVNGRGVMSEAEEEPRLPLVPESRRAVSEGKERDVGGISLVAFVHRESDHGAVTKVLACFRCPLM